MLVVALIFLTFQFFDIARVAVNCCSIVTIVARSGRSVTTSVDRVDQVEFALVAKSTEQEIIALAVE
jgi:hypothetical protein